MLIMTVRIVLAACGLAAAGWGVVLAVDVPEHGSLLAWFVSGPLLHDIVIAPLVALLGLALARGAGPAWRAPAAVGATLTGVLGVLAIPLLWRPESPVNPGLHDRDHLAGLAVAVAVVWLLVGVCGLWRNRRGRAGTEWMSRRGH